jgi:hypothetical protein
MDLQARRGTQHPELACFETWKEVVEYSKTDEGNDLKLMVKLVEEFGAQQIRDALKDMPKEEQADLVVSTPHKSKGREWDTVRLGPDFPTANKMDDADRRLLYVAATRAKLTLDVSECPPFCGGYDGRDTWNPEKDGWVPGLRINYTSPMPTEEAQAAWVAAKANGKAAPAPTATTPATTAPVPQPTQPSARTVVANGGFTWTKFSDTWVLRGPVNAANVGDRVRVSRKNGSISEETIRQIVRKFDDAWIYGV